MYFKLRALTKETSTVIVHLTDSDAYDFGPMTFLLF